MITNESKVTIDDPFEQNNLINNDIASGDEMAAPIDPLNLEFEEDYIPPPESHDEWFQSIKSLNHMLFLKRPETEGNYDSNDTASSNMGDLRAKIGSLEQQSLSDVNTNISENPHPIHRPSIGRSTTEASIDETNDHNTTFSISSHQPTILIENDIDVETLLSEILNDSDMDSAMHTSILKSDNSLSTDGSRNTDSEAVFDSKPGHKGKLNEGSSDLEVFLSQEKHFFILSTAGKPIYSMHGDDDMIMSYMGVLLTIISFFQGQSYDTDKSDQLKSFTAGNTLFVASYEDPLILVAVSKKGENEQQLRNQIDVLYTQILSTLTKSQISRVFQGRTNFDLRRLLGGTEKFLNALTREICDGSSSILLSALECAKLPKAIRERITTILLSHKSPSLLYGLIVSDSRLVSVIRPRKHSLHPPDLLLLFNMIFHTTAFRDGEEHWVPICLPKFNSTGFLYAHIFQFSKNSVLVLISADKNAFFELRTVKDNVIRSLKRDNLIKPIELAVNNGFSFRTIDIPAPQIRHFLYKSKLDVQFIMPNIEIQFFPTPDSRKSLMKYYHKLHAMVHARNGGKLKMSYFTENSVTFFGCDSPLFELYCVTGPNTTKAVLSLSIRAILAWVSKNKERLFIMGGGVF